MLLQIVICNLQFVYNESLHYSTHTTKYTSSINNSGGFEYRLTVVSVSFFPCFVFYLVIAKLFGLLWSTREYEYVVLVRVSRTSTRKNR